MLDTNTNKPLELTPQQEKQSEVKGRREIRSVFDRKLIIKGTLWFALITVLTIAGIFFYNNTGQTIKALSHI
jgi:hypothetical protein